MGETGEFVAPQLVRLDKLNFPKNLLPYFEDCLVKPKLVSYKQRRGPWFKAFESWDKHDIDNDKVKAAFSKMPNGILNSEIAQEERKEIVILLAVVFSLISEAALKDGPKGWTNYATKHPNSKGMTNYLLGRTKASSYAKLIHKLIETARLPILQKNAKVNEHIERALAGFKQGGSQQMELLLTYFFPEIFDETVRSELIYFGELPLWATSENA
jgi:hypothetical protein